MFKWNSAKYFGNGYFDNDNGQTLFLDGILVIGILLDIMGASGEI